MNSPKKIGVVLGISFVILLFLVIFGNYLESGAPSVNPPTQQQSILSEKVPTIAKNPDSNSLETEQEISKKIAASILELNPEGPIDFDNEKVIKALNPETIANNLVRQELEKIEELDLGLDDIQINDIKTIKSSDPALAADYFKNFQKILKNNFSGGEISWNNFATNDFNLLINAHQQAINEFYRLETPISLADIHKEQILLLTKQTILLTRLRDAEIAPLEAMAAIQKMGIVNAEFNNLKDKVLRFIDVNKIKI